MRAPTLYTDTLSKFSGRESLAIDEIEKDLNRSLPEYAGFQGDEGIGRLRRVLTAYSWINEEIGYCQAMNIVVAALLMYVLEAPISRRSPANRFYSYMSEPQAFFLLSVLCDRLLPGYYSTTMYGTLLDQKVFESLVEKTMPILWEHLIRSDVQLSVVSLPWFLSLYINSMPLVFAIRVLDVFFLEGPKVLFQVGLAILRINGEELLDVTDDGAFISILKSYFSRLDESAHPRSENAKLRAVTRFQELMVVAFKEFSGITHSTITEERAKHKGAVLENIENFAKRTSIRNLGPDSKRLSAEDLGAIYDRFYEILYQQQQRTKEEEKRQEEKESRKSAARYSMLKPNVEAEVGRVGLGPSPSHMHYDAFREFLAATARWAITDSPTSPKDSTSDRSSYNGGTMRGRGKFWDIPGKPEPADHDFMRRLYIKWNVDGDEGLSLQNVVNGLARLKGTRDIMSNISYFFNLYDDDGTGTVNREGILRMSEAFLFLSRRGFEGMITASSPEDNDSTPVSPHVREVKGKGELSTVERFLSSVSDFIQRCFEYADPSHPQNQDKETTETEEKLGAFSVGGDEDKEEDLLDLNQDSSSNAGKETSSTRLNTPSKLRTSAGSKRASESANVALDPAHPLHITLPTFRMVVLADELLEQFFESFFPQSFHLSDRPDPASISSTTSLSSNLTTFAKLSSGRQASGSQTASGVPVAGATGGIAPPGQHGLRGVLDNIVSDGMRVAAEVRKKMDEAQREMERNVGGRPEDDEDDEDDDDAAYDERRRGASVASGSSARKVDLDLLEGADAMSIREKESGDRDEGDAELDAHAPRQHTPSSVRDGDRQSGTDVVSKVVEFDS